MAPTARIFPFMIYNLCSESFLLTVSPSLTNALRNYLVSTGEGRAEEIMENIQLGVTKSSPTEQKTDLKTASHPKGILCYTILPPVLFVLMVSTLQFCTGKLFQGV